MRHLRGCDRIGRRPSWPPIRWDVWSNRGSVGGSVGWWANRGNVGGSVGWAGWPEDRPTPPWEFQLSQKATYPGTRWGFELIKSATCLTCGSGEPPPGPSSPPSPSSRPSSPSAKSRRPPPSPSLPPRPLPRLRVRPPRVAGTVPRMRGGARLKRQGDGRQGEGASGEGATRRQGDKETRRHGDTETRNPESVSPCRLVSRSPCHPSPSGSPPARREYSAASRTASSSPGAARPRGRPGRKADGRARTGTRDPARAPPCGAVKSPPMRRKLFTLAAGVSALLCAGVCVLWFHSSDRWDDIGWAAWHLDGRRPAARMLRLCAADGRWSSYERMDRVAGSWPRPCRSRLPKGFMPVPWT